MYNKRRNHEQDLQELKERFANRESSIKIAKALRCSTAYIQILKEKSIENGTWFTDEELQKLGRKTEGKRKKKRDRHNSIIEQEICELKHYFGIYGNNLEEIANVTPYTVRYLKELMKIARNRGLWFSEDEEKDILERTEIERQYRAEAEKHRQEKLEQILDEERIRRKEERARVIEKYLRTTDTLEERKAEEAKENKQVQKSEENNAIEQENNETEQEKETINQSKKTNQSGKKVQKGTRKPTGPKIQRDPLFEEYEKRRKAAKREDKLEMNGRENVSTEGRIRFVDILAKLQGLDMQISNDDIEIILNGYDMHPEIANTKGIRVLINDANQKGGIYGAEKRVNELIGALKRTRFHPSLLKYRSYLRKLNLLPKINEMKKEGLGISTIATRLGLSLMEIKDILNSDEKKEFSDSDDMDM